MAAQIGDAVLGHHKIAKLVGDSRASVAPTDVRLNLAIRLARASDHQDGAAIFQRVRHRHKVVLTADSAQHTSILQHVGGDGSAQGGDEAGVYESRGLPLRSLQFLLTVKLIDERDPGHAELLALGTIHTVERIVEASRSEKEAGVGNFAALDPAFENPAAIELEEAVHQHLRRRIESFSERSRPAHAV